MGTTWINRGHMYSPHVTPVLADCNFIVDTANGNGLGIRSLKGQAVVNVFMHTTSTPGRGNNQKLNPNPPAGYILVQLADNYTRSYGGFNSTVSPLSGSPATSTTANIVYVITSLGTATPAQWLAAGLPPGITPALGAAFVATATGTIGGSATVDVPASSGFDHIETVGDPNTTLGPAPSGPSPNVGGMILLRCLLNTATATPTDGTVIALTMSLNQSSVLVAGE